MPPLTYRRSVIAAKCILTSLSDLPKTELRAQLPIHMAERMGGEKEELAQPDQSWPDSLCITGDVFHPFCAMKLSCCSSALPCLFRKSCGYSQISKVVINNCKVTPTQSFRKAGLDFASSLPHDNSQPHWLQNASEPMAICLVAGSFHGTSAQCHQGNSPACPP